MTKQEAIAAMQQGKKVTHDYFSDYEYIYIKQHEFHVSIISEDGVNHGWQGFWELRNSIQWQDGWSLYK